MEFKPGSNGPSQRDNDVPAWGMLKIRCQECKLIWVMFSQNSRTFPKQLGLLMTRQCTGGILARHRWAFLAGRQCTDLGDVKEKLSGMRLLNSLVRGAAAVGAENSFWQLPSLGLVMEQPMEYDLLDWPSSADWMNRG